MKSPFVVTFFGNASPSEGQCEVDPISAENLLCTCAVVPMREQRSGELMKKLVQTFVGVVLVALIIALLSLRAEASTNSANAIAECSLKGEGIVKNAWVKHRIFIGEEPVFGANDMDRLSIHLKDLRHAGLCR
jgi:hypothetical protein